MITTRRTAVSDKAFETKQNTIIETDFKTDSAPAFVDVEPVRVTQPEITARVLPASDKEDIMPTIKAENRKQEKVVAEVKSQESEAKVVKADHKTKVIMMTYMAVAFILAMIVMATGLIITNRTAELNALQGDVNLAYDKMLGQQNQMDYLSDELVVSSKADAMGMTNASGAEVIAVIPLNDQVTYEAKTNGFDKFCDFVSNLIGG